MTENKYGIACLTPEQRKVVMKNIKDVLWDYQFLPTARDENVRLDLEKIHNFLDLGIDEWALEDINDIGRGIGLEESDLPEKIRGMIAHLF